MRASRSLEFRRVRRSPRHYPNGPMKNLIAAAILSLLCSCALFSSVDVKPALEANAGMQRVFESHSGAFEKLMLVAKMDDGVRLQILNMIQKDRAAFTLLNTTMAQFVGAMGELSPSDIVEFVRDMKKLYDEVTAEEETAEAPGASSG